MLTAITPVILDVLDIVFYTSKNACLGINRNPAASTNTHHLPSNTWLRKHAKRKVRTKI